MKISYFFLLTVCAASSAYAGSTVTDSSYGTDYTVYSTAAPVVTMQPVSVQSNPIIDSLSNLQAEVSQLKNKVAEIKARQDRLESVSWTPTPSPKQQVNLFPAPGINPATPPQILGEKNQYDYAYSLFRTGAYDQAISQFQSIIKAYPKGEYADNSQYWTGEALLKKNNKTDALRAFDRLVYAYPKSAKVPDALLKLGMTLSSVGNKPKAKEYFDYLIANYPNTHSGQAAVAKRVALQ